jgi:hypothetical protein
LILSTLNKTHLDFDDLVFDNFIYSVTALFRNTQSNVAAIPDGLLIFHLEIGKRTYGC